MRHNPVLAGLCTAGLLAALALPVLWFVSHQGIGLSGPAFLTGAVALMLGGITAAVTAQQLSDGPVAVFKPMSTDGSATTRKTVWTVQFPRRQIEIPNAAPRVLWLIDLPRHPLKRFHDHQLVLVLEHDGHLEPWLLVHQDGISPKVARRLAESLNIDFSRHTVSSTTVADLRSAEKGGLNAC